MGADYQGQAYRLSSQGNSVTSSSNTNDHVVVGYVNVNTAAASSSVNIWAGQNSTSGTLIAKIDTTSAAQGTKAYFVNCHGGFWANMQGGNADVTITTF